MTGWHRPLHSQPSDAQQANKHHHDALLLSSVYSPLFPGKTPLAPRRMPERTHCSTGEHPDFLLVASLVPPV